MSHGFDFVIIGWKCNSLAFYEELWKNILIMKNYESFYQLWMFMKLFLIYEGGWQYGK